jgi:hypothetical protein
MRRVAAILALAAAAALLGGCVYDPYTGAMVQCCGYYGYPYGYRYPAPYGPYGYTAAPYGGQPAANDDPPGSSYGGAPGGSYGAPTAGPYGGSPPPAQPSAYPVTPGGAAPRSQGGSLALRFAAANVTNDGRLTHQQAADAMPLVAQNFDAIDRDGRGYVTLSEIQAFMAQRRAAGGQPGQFDAN